MHFHALSRNRIKSTSLQYTTKTRLRKEEGARGNLLVHLGHCPPTHDWLAVHSARLHHDMRSRALAANPDLSNQTAKCNEYKDITPNLAHVSPGLPVDMNFSHASPG